MLTTDTVPSAVKMLDHGVGGYRLLTRMLLSMIQATKCYKFVSVILKTETNKLLLDKIRQQLRASLFVLKLRLQLAFSFIFLTGTSLS